MLMVVLNMLMFLLITVYVTQPIVHVYFMEVQLLQDNENF